MSRGVQDRATPHHTPQVDLATGEGLAECLQELGPLAAVVNCAAISQPVACERGFAAAAAINVPSRLLDALEASAAVAEAAGGGDAQGAAPPLLIHLSTDQVGQGSVLVASR